MTTLVSYMQNKLNVASKIWRGLKLFLKWSWLLTMFLLGIAVFLVMPFVIFEYSFSLSELDLIETLFITLLLVFVYQYIKLCFQSKVSLVRKIITPWVHQAHVFLVFIVLLFMSIKQFKLKLDDLERIPLLYLFECLIMVGTMGYSYYRVKTLDNQPRKASVTVCREGATE